MSAFLLIALKVAFLVLLWGFILFVALVIRTDLFGRRVTAEELAGAGAVADQPRRRRRRERAAETPSLQRPNVVRVTTGRAAGTAVALPTGNSPLLIGRAADAGLDIEDDYASSRHARIYSHEDGWVIEDLQSTNGTYVNGQAISAPTLIGPEDTVRIGRSQLVLEVQ